MTNVNDLKSGKVKLEFGNKTQVKLIDEYQKKLAKEEDLEAIKNDDAILKEYEFFDEDGKSSHIIEAYDEEDAMDEAWFLKIRWRFFKLLGRA